MPSGNFVSMANAIEVNGYYIYTGNLSSFLFDIASFQIVSVFPCTVNDGNGVSTDAFKFTITNTKGVTATTVYLPVNEHLTSIADVDAGLTAISSTNQFTVYTGLLRSSEFPTGWYAGKSVLINDALCSRAYVPDSNETWVTVSANNSLNKVLYVFSGDQTFAGNQYYLYATGNVNPF